ncbi:MAG: hypothetical protein H6Q67_2284 [Firmicutes bacterium]|nr:hypothetical protein [Bacillota bacterium]
MNTKKWGEIRLAMYQYPLPIMWRTKDLLSGHVSDWDAEWYYHFKCGGYESIEWLEIDASNKEIKNAVIKILQKIHVPGIVMENSIFILGYCNSAVDYV